MMTMRVALVLWTWMAAAMTTNHVTTAFCPHTCRSSGQAARNNLRHLMSFDPNQQQQQQQQQQELIPETSFGAEAVPEGQRPVNEYLDISRQPLFGWASTDSGSQGLLLRLGIVYVVSFALLGWPIAGATYTQDEFFWQKVTAANIGALSLIAFLLLRLYSGWDYVGTRLTSKVIEFEETGWYDGDYEFKTESEMKRDKFLYQEKVRPVVKRLQTFTLALGALFLASIVAFNVANTQNPMFDEYDPRMLERLNYDEKLAERAAMSSGGKPIYCDNRYYRAVAGGGQGCN